MFDYPWSVTGFPASGAAAAKAPPLVRLASTGALARYP